MLVSLAQLAGACRSGGAGTDATGGDAWAAGEEVGALAGDPAADAGGTRAPDALSDVPVVPDSRSGLEAIPAGEVGAPPACTGTCNAVTPAPPSVTAEGGRGNVTMYTTEASSGGACNYGATAVLYFAAVNVNVVPGDGQGQWQGGRICGQCAEVAAQTSHGPMTTVVRIMDKCPDANCGMDLGGAAPAVVMSDGFGRYEGSWHFVSCTGHPEVFDGPASIFVVAGASAYWSRVQVRNGAGAVTSLAWRDPQGTSGSLAWASDPENTFEVPASLLQSGAANVSVTATFSDGSSATVALTPGQLASGGTSYAMK